MQNWKKVKLMALGALVVALIAVSATVASEKKDTVQKSSEATMVTNDNGTVSRTFTECSVATNGSMVTEHRRETRTTLDADGNMLESSTSEYAQSYAIGDSVSLRRTAAVADHRRTEQAEADSASFMGLKFGEEFKGTNFVADADEPTLLRATFKPQKPLADFNDFYVYVTPKTHQVVKVYACAKEAVEPGTSWRRHYLIEALEKRYQTWARPRSSFRPIYSFDIGGGRFVTTVLAGATRDYETIVVAWDEALLMQAAEETEELRAEARKAAAEKRNRRVSAAAEAF